MGRDIFSDLNDALFAQMNKLQTVDKGNKEQFAKTLAQSKAVADLASNIIDNNNSKIRAMQFFEGLSKNVDSIIEQRGKMLVGTTGDYRPLSFREEDGTYWGFGIEMANEIAKRMGVTVEFVQTSWPTLTADVQAERWTAGHPPFRICH